MTEKMRQPREQIATHIYRRPEGTRATQASPLHSAPPPPLRDVGDGRAMQASRREEADSRRVMQGSRREEAGGGRVMQGSRREEASSMDARKRVVTRHREVQ